MTRKQRLCREAQQRRWARVYATPLDRFWSKVNKSDGCWSWTAGRTYLLNGIKTNPARAMWILTYGPLAGPNIIVTSRCGNKDCIRPEHLILVARGKHVAHAPIEKRFSAKVDVRGPDECWEWKGATHNGYGSVQFRGRVQPAHRVAWILAHGEIPKGLQACHHCDNPPCVNVRHLFIGTNQDNQIDCVKKGRKNAAAGERNSKAKLTDATVRQLRQEAPTGKQCRERARQLGVTKGTIYRALNGKGWTHIHQTKPTPAFSKVAVLNG